VANKRSPQGQRSPSAAPDGESDRYAVGYGKPPKQHQFPPGRSGNPRGRPARKNLAQDSDPTLAMLGMGRIAFEKVKVTQNGKVVSMPAIEAVQRRRVNDALKGGNRLLQRELIEEAEEYQRQALEAEMKRFVRLRALKEQGERRLADARSRGLPEPQLLPHPMDIVIDEDALTAEIIGPETKEQLATCNFVLAFRHLCVLRAVYQTRFPPLLSAPPTGIRSRMADVANALDQALCPRLQWGRYGFSKAMAPFQRVGFRFLEATLTAAFNKVERMWSSEPALEPFRRDRRMARVVEQMLRFKTRARERVLAQRVYERSLLITRMAFGDTAAEQLPKRFSASRFAESQRKLDVLPDNVKQQLEAFSQHILDAGLLKLS
jgi:hypothetical protein